MSFLNRSKPLGHLPRFGNLSEKEMKRVCEAGREVRVPQGWSLLNESTAPDQAYLVISGELEVRHKGEHVATLGSGEIVGEMSILQHKLRNGSVTASTPLELLHLTGDAFKKLYDEMPSFKSAVDETVEARQSQD